MRRPARPRASSGGAAAAGGRGTGGGGGSTGGGGTLRVAVPRRPRMAQPVILRERILVWDISRRRYAILLSLPAMLLLPASWTAWDACNESCPS